MSRNTALVPVVVPSAAASASITLPASTWGYSSWVQLIASTSTPIVISGITYGASGIGADNDHEVEIGVGGVGSEVPVVRFRTTVANPGSGSFPQLHPAPVPVSVASGVRVSVRTRSSSNAAGTLAVALTYYANFDSANKTTLLLTCSPAGATGLSLTPSATPWANSAWVEVTPNSNSIGVVGIAWRQSAISNVDLEFDVGTGSSGSETVVTTIRTSMMAAGGGRFFWVYLPAMLPVAAGSRIAIRVRKGGTSTATVSATLLYYDGFPALAAEICPSGPWTVAISTVDQTSHFLVSSGSIEYTLGAQGNATINIFDGGAVASAYRPGTENLIKITKGVDVFLGRILSVVETPMGDVNSGTMSVVHAADYHRALAKVLFTGGFGQYLYTYVDTGVVYTKTDPEMINITVSNPGLVTTRFAHLLNTGDTVRFTDVAGGVTPNINDTDFQVTVLNAVQFTIPVNITVQGNGGKIHKLTLLSTIAAAVVAQLTTHGITLVMTSDGPWVMPQSFTRAWCEDVLNTCCKEVGWVYRIRSDKTLEIFNLGDVVASFTLRNDNSNIIGPISIDKTDQDYVNTLSVLYGDPSLGTIRRIDRFFGDGATTSWLTLTPQITLGNRLAYGYVDVDGVHKTLSLPGDLSADWHFDPATSILSTTAAAPATGIVIDFPYDGNAQASVIVSDPTAIAAVGGEIYEATWDAGNVSIDTALIKGAAELARRSVSARKLTVVTMICLVRPGTVIPVNYPDRNLSGNWLVIAVTMRDQEAADPAQKAWYTYQLLEAGLPTTWVDFWRGV